MKGELRPSKNHLWGGLPHLVRISCASDDTFGCFFFHSGVGGGGGGYGRGEGGGGRKGDERGKVALGRELYGRCDMLFMCAIKAFFVEVGGGM